MARIKYMTSVAVNDKLLPHSIIIDSGSSHHFIQRKGMFLNYEQVVSKAVQSATGESIVIGKGQVRLPIDGGVLVNDFHTPNFSTNIISVGQLSHLYDINFNPTIANRKISASVLSKKFE